MYTLSDNRCKGFHKNKHIFNTGRLTKMSSKRIFRIATIP